MAPPHVHRYLLPSLIWCMAALWILHISCCGGPGTPELALDGLQYLLLSLRVLTVPNHLRHADAKHRVALPINSLELKPVYK